VEVDPTLLNEKGVFFFGFEVIRSKVMVYREGWKDEQE
jgi:hypothetical protein